MTFATPTTQEEMFAILREIFLYYRVKRQRYEGITLDNLSLERMQSTTQTEQELKDKAKLLLSAKHVKDILDYKNSLITQIEAVKNKINSTPKSMEILIDEIKKGYVESEQKIEQKAVQNGVVNSSVIIDKLCVLEQNKNAEINKLKADCEKTKSELESELKSLQTKLEKADEYFEQMHSKEIDVKAKELMSELEKVEREVFKFNCSQDEKEQRYANDIIKTNASLEIRYLEINAEDFTKDQLVEMGYYDAVSDCVSAYLNTLDPVSAYDIIKNRSRLGVYLEHYYENFLILYKSLAVV